MPGASPAFEGLNAVTVHITDVARSRAFYGEVLGLTEVGYEPERQRLVYALPGTSTLLTMHVMSDTREGGREPGTVSGLVFGHRDPAAGLEEIRRRGGSIVAEATKLPSGFVRGVFADPDGNEFILASSR